VIAAQRRDLVFLGASAVVFAASAAITILWCASMSAMNGMPMPGGWTMSMVWMPVPGRTWFGGAASFLTMWTVMMVGMMLPSLVPVLWRCRQAIAGTSEMRRDGLAALVGAGYFVVWSVVGMAVFSVGMALAGMAMRQPTLARTAPIAAGVVVVFAGVAQFTGWKARHLECCRRTCAHGRAWRPNAGRAWRDGLRLGVHCGYCCAPLTLVLLVAGVMDLRAMAAVAIAITSERAAADGRRSARAIGVVLVGAGFWLTARAIWPHAA
jgi:predicted metal-binding membrane protein